MVHSERSLIIDMLVSSFSENRRVLSMLRSTSQKHLRSLFNYVYTLAEQVGETFIPSQRSNVIVYFQNSKKRPTLRSSLALIHFLCHCNWRNLRHNLMINKTIKSIRNKEVSDLGIRDYIYVWFLAGNKERAGYRGLSETMAHLRNLSRIKDLPIYLETTVPRMVPIYSKAGFVFYKKKQIGELNIWFAKFEADEK